MDRVNSRASPFSSRDDTAHEEGPYCSPHELEINEPLDIGQIGFPELVQPAAPLPQASSAVHLNHFYGHDIANDPDTAISCSMEPSSQVEARADMDTFDSLISLDGLAPIYDIKRSDNWNPPITHQQDPRAQLLSLWESSIQQNNTPPHLGQFTPSSTTPNGGQNLVTNSIPGFFELFNTWPFDAGGDHLNALYGPMEIFSPVSLEGGYTCFNHNYHSQIDVGSSNATSQLLQRTRSVMSDEGNARSRHRRSASRSSASASSASSGIAQAHVLTAESAENLPRRTGRQGPLSRETNANAQQNRMEYLTCYNCKAKKVTYLVNCHAVPQWFKPFIFMEIDSTSNMCLMEAYMRDFNIRVQCIDETGEFTLRLSSCHELWQQYIFKQSTTCSMVQFVTGLSFYYELKYSDYLDVGQCDWAKPMEAFLQLDSMSNDVKCYLTGESGCRQLDEPMIETGVLENWQQRLCFISVATFQHLRQRLEMLACSHLERDLTSRTTAQGNNAIKHNIEALNLFGRYLLSLRRRISIWKRELGNGFLADPSPFMDQDVLWQASAQMDSFCYDLYSRFCFQSQSLDLSLRNQVEMERITTHPDTGPRREYLPSIKGEAGFVAWMRDGETLTGSVEEISQDFDLESTASH
ncbi:hypothetical protein E4U21_004187 [Claviceps maximensis]|nr:hypothetical protein E4U21_004187 [Claviceps maximensis]